MTETVRSARAGGTYLLQRAKSAGPSFRYKSPAQDSERRSSQGSTVVVYVDEHCPSHGSQSKCTCTSYITNDNNRGSTNSLTQNDEVVLTNIKPFNNNPALPLTQRDIVGNNLKFNSASQLNGWNDEQLGSLLVYRDALKQNLTTRNLAGGGFPRMRIGRSGGHWRHIQQTNSHSGSNLLYINGIVRTDDSFKYPIPRFGYPPMNQPQYVNQSSSNQDLSNNLTNSTSKSLDYSTWSATAELNRRPSLSQYTNRYQQHAKEGFSYWPTEGYKKPRCKTGTTGTYKTWLGLSDAVLKL